MARSDEDLGALALAEVSRLAKTVRELGEEQKQTAEQLAQTAELLGAKDPDFLLAPWWWPRLNRDEASDAWDALTRFVDEVLIPIYDGGFAAHEPGELRQGTHIKACWFAHPDSVQRLSDLHYAWRRDYARNPPITGPLEWGQTWVERTLKAVDPGTECSKYCKRYEAATGQQKRPGKLIGAGIDAASMLNGADRMRFIDSDIKSRPEGG